MRRLRGRFGIAAPRMAVRTHVPWHWRAASIIVITAASLALAGWVYDAGRSIAGFNSSKMDTLKTKVHDQEAELTELRAKVTTTAASLQIEQTTQEQLKKQVASLGADNARLKEELAVFEHMAQGQGVEGGLSIARLRIEPGDTPDEFTYRMLVTQQQGKKGNEFKGLLQLALTVQQGGSNVMIILPKAGDVGANRFQVSFRHFQRLEGNFKVPTGGRLISVEARLVQDGAVKASQRIAL
ncbi:MAG TPA: DUF6776 family protein [Rhodocyclaceae bacterium]|nr:DUF6776 family protein [Rhodocyclaceae bacterium]